MTFTFTKSGRRFSGILGATSLSVIKPMLRNALRRPVKRLFEAGISANQVTMASIAGSALVGVVLTWNHELPMLFLVLPVWLAIRTALASMDGALAIDFGQKSRLGGYLNEGGDILSEMALWTPIIAIAPATAPAVILIVILAIVAEVVGAVGPVLGGARRVEGPLGKADRSIVLAVFGVASALTGGLPLLIVEYGLPLVALLLILTIAMRLRGVRLVARDFAGRESTP